MNEAIQTILSRRSIRAFKKDQLKEQELQIILEAGKYAPSAMNGQSWHFTVIQNKEMLKKINAVCRDVYARSGNSRFEERAKAEDFSICHNAPTYIIVSADEKAIAPVADAAVALENMFLAAKALGIGSCWIHAVNYLFGTTDGKALFAELGVPAGYRPLCSGAFGYSAVEMPLPAPRKEGTVNLIL